jgi:hypothetical protein
MPPKVVCEPVVPEIAHERAQGREIRVHLRRKAAAENKPPLAPAEIQGVQNSKAVMDKAAMIEE